MIAVAMLLATAGCSKIDKGVCWSAETKELLHQKIAAQSDVTQKQVDLAQLRYGIIRSQGMGLVNIAATDFNLEKIDQAAAAADCSFEFSVAVDFGNQKLKSAGRIPFSIRAAETGKTLTISAGSIHQIMDALQ
ncbi:hypothetical protein CUN61_15990 [Pseudomonas arsenicoxydans]|uniref:Uncharacterized protein n=1 Tax=Pseudomonas arsenicoxydans TaxID=702115 RepID=A0A4P6GIT9_9PSED|nr:hypothetical protein CUN61_15990 [Pseudomonas arsenicoxydans]